MIIFGVVFLVSFLFKRDCTKSYGHFFFSSFSNVDFVIFVIIDISISRVYLFFVYMYY
ncbi:hypothetical protein MG5_03089 [Candida albicans P57072]|uniref:Uncharacterized protein n=1 Tax=Candida albicans P78048 TaxID=1094989 RepID=A0AB34PS50_CANAX|nr:hypothetical protein MG1_03088 [Candida albicans GC75]KGR08737.1 hypothetical protein MG5_03089 [Candida albicans P57072]KGR09929.1 hypothetical protein MG9_04858 [Candida albicans P37037]KGR11078.1 hypothetical protein MG3_03103 [Candida albicans P78048]KGU09869.1 hypothetical protein MEY_03056 [Candida albicans 19F]KGU10467.1 hypothetical protein MEQ_03044 [Candida albicans P87]KGU31441.1 hypothetical protein MGM_03071 [Candida albicans P75063]KHC35389.1 hypothetical protein MGO_03068 [